VVIGGCVGVLDEEVGKPSRKESASKAGSGKEKKADFDEREQAEGVKFTVGSFLHAQEASYPFVADASRLTCSKPVHGDETDESERHGEFGVKTQAIACRRFETPALMLCYGDLLG
jgi:hypothetical protein